MCQSVCLHPPPFLSLYNVHVWCDSLSKNMITATVSNKDVMERVKAVEATVNDTKMELTERMDAQSKEISDELAGTLDTLHKAVEKAQAEIQSEVQQVKGDVDSYVRTTQDQFSMENSFMIYQLAGTFVLIGSLISMWHMTAHLRKFNQPMVQVSV
jgi:gas vesicle protein